MSGLDDLTSKITQILNDPGGMDMVKNLAASLMADKDKPAENADAEPSGIIDSLGALGNLGNLSGLSSLLSGIGSNNSGQDNDSDPQSPSGLSDLSISPQQIGMMMRVMSALKSNDKDNSDVKLLMALKPHLSEERQKKADNAAKMLKLASLLPLIKESGLFDIF